MSGRTPLSRAAVDVIRKRHPELPDEYFDYLLSAGWGIAASGRMIYKAPIAPDSIFPGRFSTSSIVLLGDDFQGYCLAFDKKSKRLGEVSDFGEWQPWKAQKEFSDYVRGDE